MRHPAALVVSLLVICGLGRIAGAQAARAELRLDDSPHVDVPFHVDLVVDGFDEAPAPAQPKLELAGASVVAIGAQPSVSRSIQIINGRRVDATRVTWVMRWRVLATRPGRLAVPAVTVTQGTRSATTPAGEIQVAVVPIADDMKLALELPARPVFVGETVPLRLVWLFRRQPEDPSFTVPLMSLDTFTISGPPPTNARNVLDFDAGTKTIKLPYVIDRQTVNGVEYNRLVVEFFAAPRAAPPGGKLEVPPSSVAVKLAVGRADFFGNAPSRLFRATDVTRSLEVKPLPESDRPPSFAGAVGDQFAISVDTSRSVVQLGEPVELEITVKSNQRLDTLVLGKLDIEGRLPRDKFTVADDPPTGQLSDDGKTKTFKVVAQVTGPATEVPAIVFSYFDPSKGVYQSIHSEPIALSVKGGSIVGAGDVVAAAPAKQRSGPVVDDTALVNADLALSSPGAVGDRPLGGTPLWLLIALLYAVPLALLGLRSWQLRTAGQREEAAEVRTARRRVEDLLDRSSAIPAREIAGPLGAALRELARVLGRDPDDGGLLAQLETESFAPEAAGRPLSTDLRSNAAGLLRRWQQDVRRPGSAKPAAVASLLLVLALAPAARADALSEGRASYQQAMELAGDATSRRNAFARAAIAFGEAVREDPARHELLADWGNAALGAGDVAIATLAYRRALAVDGSNARARHNLGWLRSRQADAFRPSSTTSATDSLLFFHHWPRARRLLAGAGAFAIAVLLVVPWAGRRRRSLAGLAVLPLAVWIAMVASVITEDRHTDDAVVMDGVVLRAADSAGAPAALTQPLPRGAEVTILERRGPWTRIRIGSGSTGWVPAGALEPVAS